LGGNQPEGGTEKQTEKREKSAFLMRRPKKGKMRKKGTLTDQRKLRKAPKDLKKKKG